MYEPIDIKSGKAEVISSGTITSFEGNPIEITFGPSNLRLKIIFNFIDEPNSQTKKELKMQGEVINNTTLKLNLYNFESSIQSGSIKPIQIGTINKNTILLHFRVVNAVGIDKTLYYSIYCIIGGANNGK